MQDLVDLQHVASWHRDQHWPVASAQETRSDYSLAAVSTHRTAAIGLTLWALLDKFAARQMLDVHLRTDGRQLIFRRHTQRENPATWVGDPPRASPTLRLLLRARDQQHGLDPAERSTSALPSLSDAEMHALDFPKDRMPGMRTDADLGRVLGSQGTQPGATAVKH